MRKIYCPSCASEIQWNSHQFVCGLGPELPLKLGSQLKSAVYTVEPATDEVRYPEIAPYLWCPNCTGTIDEGDVREGKLQCVHCGLRLPLALQDDLATLRYVHVQLDQIDELFVDSADQAEPARLGAGAA